jgi:hypothetical protein
MTVAAILLFGSFARSDQSEGSDTDLLLIGSGEETRHFSVAHLSMFLYPWPRLQFDARNGDLFVCHLVRESKAIFDPDGYLVFLRKLFRLRSNYQREIGQATDLGWFLVRFRGEFNSALEAKRILWCVRTILIARSAERGEPAFAPDILADQSRSSFARKLITKRHSQLSIESMRKCLLSFLTEQATFDHFHKEADRTAFIDRFSSTSNKVAIQTLQQERLSQTGYI